MICSRERGADTRGYSNPARLVFQEGAGVGFGADQATNASAIPLLLWAFNGRGSRDQVYVASEAAVIVRGVATTIVGQPFDRAEHAVQLAGSVLTGGDAHPTDYAAPDSPAP